MESTKPKTPQSNSTINPYTKKSKIAPHRNAFRQKHTNSTIKTVILFTKNVTKKYYSTGHKPPESSKNKHTQNAWTP